MSVWLFRLEGTGRRREEGGKRRKTQTKTDWERERESQVNTICIKKEIIFEDRKRKRGDKTEQDRKVEEKTYSAVEIREVLSHSDSPEVSLDATENFSNSSRDHALYRCVEKYDNFSELWLLTVAVSSATPAFSLNVSHLCHQNTSSNRFQSQTRPCLRPRCQHNKFLVNVKHNFIVKDVIIHDSMPSYRKIVGQVRQSHSGLYVIVTTWKLTEVGKERLVFFSFFFLVIRW